MLKQLLMKSLLVAAGLLVGASAWAAITTPYSWTFTGNATDADITKNTEVKITESKTECNPATAPSDCVGLYFNDAWKRYKSTTGLRNVSRGDRMCVIPDLKKDDVVTINCNNTDYINTTKYPGIASASKKSISFAMEADGNFYFKMIKAGGTVDGVKVYPSIYSITVTRGTDTSEFDALKAYADALIAVSNDNSVANSTLSAAISTQAAAVASATNQVAVMTATSTLLAAMNAYVATANPLTGSQFDLTFLLTNPNLEGIADNGDAAAQGWYTDIPRSDLGTYNNFQVRTSLLNGLNAVERFTSKACTTANAYGLYQKVTLPVGNYSFSAKAMANQATSIVMAAGDTEGDAVTSAGAFADYNVDFSIDAAGETNVGIKISSTGTNTCYWMALTKLKLYKEPVSTVSKTITAAGYATLCSPYALDFTGSGLTAYRAEIDGSKNVTFTEVTQVPANEGVLVKGTAGEHSINVIASAAAITNAFVGTVEGTTAEAGSFVLMATPKVGFYKAKSAFTVGAGTAYLPKAASAREFIGFDSETTGIESVQGEGLKVNGSVNYYNLNGQRVAAPTKGLYIVNGKKVIVK